MKTLVIHPTDASTEFLTDIYTDKPDWTIIKHAVNKEYLMQQIGEHDRIVLLGHGSPHGLFGFGGYVIDETYGELLATKKCINIWCHAVYFGIKHKLNGFFTDMFISEKAEANYCNIEGTEEEINYSNILFSTLLKGLVDTESLIKPLKMKYQSSTNSIIKYNYSKLYEANFSQEKSMLFTS